VCSYLAALIDKGGGMLSDCLYQGLSHFLEPLRSDNLTYRAIMESGCSSLWALPQANNLLALCLS
jgi:hypothetical protein